MCRTKERAGDSLSVPCPAAPGHAVDMLNGGAPRQATPWRSSIHAALRLCALPAALPEPQSSQLVRKALRPASCARTVRTGDAPERVCARMATVLMVELVMFIRMGIGRPFNAQ